MADNNQPEQSEFNLALSTLERVNYLLTAAALCSQRRALHDWYDILLTLSKDIDYLFKDNEEKINIQFKAKLNPLDAEYCKYEATEKLHKFTKYGWFAELLRRYEKFLRQGYNARNMLMLKAPDKTTAYGRQ